MATKNLIVNKRFSGGIIRRKLFATTKPDRNVSNSPSVYFNSSRLTSQRSTIYPAIVVTNYTSFKGTSLASKLLLQSPPPLFHGRACSSDARIQGLEVPSLLSGRTLSTATRIQRLNEPLLWSYLSGGGQKPLLGLTIGQAMDRARDLYGDREAVVSVHQDIRKTFYDLHKDVSLHYYCLSELSLTKNDRGSIATIRMPGKPSMSCTRTWVSTGI